MGKCDMDHDDPLDWSTDRVVLELCHTKSPQWAEGAGLRDLIDPTAVEKALRDNHLDGDNLLALEDKDIKENLDIKSFGQRRVLGNIIIHLRTISTKYQSRALIQSHADRPLVPDENASKRKKQPKRATLIPLSEDISPHKDTAFEARTSDVATDDAFHEITRMQFEEESEDNESALPPTKRLKKSYKGDRPISHDTVDPKRGRLAMLNRDRLIAQKLEGEALTEFRFTVPKPATATATATATVHRSRAVRALNRHLLRKNHLVEIPTHTSIVSQASKSATQIQAFSKNVDDALLQHLGPDLYKLLKKHEHGAPGDLELPHYGDSDDEDDMATPEPDSPLHKGHPLMERLMRKEDVNAVIDSAIDQFKEQWRERNLLKTQAKAHRKWMTAVNKKYLHESMLNECRYMKAKAEKQVIQVREKICENEWFGRDHVKEQCSALEHSIQSIEEYQVYINILQDEHEPSKLFRSRSTKDRAVQRRVIFSNGDEDLGSESDTSSLFGNEYDTLLNDQDAMDIDGEDDCNPILSRKPGSEQVPVSRGHRDSTTPRNRQKASKVKRSSTGGLSGVQESEGQDDSQSQADESLSSTSEDLDLNFDFPIPERDSDDQFGETCTPKELTYVGSYDESFIIDANVLEQIDWEMIEREADAGNVDPELVLAVELAGYLERQIVLWLKCENTLQDGEDLCDLVEAHILSADDNDSENCNLLRESAQLLRAACLVYTNCKEFSMAFSSRGLDLDEVFAKVKQAVLELLNAINSVPQDVVSANKEDIRSKSSSSRSGPKKKRSIDLARALRAQRHADYYQLKNAHLRRLRLAKAQAATESSTDDIKIDINFKAPPVWLDPKLAKSVKPHQIEGIRFMWRKLLETGDEGCMLAHTMGLGKTMQVISVLVSLSQCKKSSDPALQALVPDHLKGNRFLILCPTTLVDNWEQEIERWMPLYPDGRSPLGHILKIDSKTKVPNPTVDTWMQEKGVLILGYDRFRGYVQNSHGYRNPEKLRSDLLEGPTIVIADEAHKLKNASSGLHKAATELQTRSRIALTGSPMNNNLQEYHTMIDWVAPGYLGPWKFFKTQFVKPIDKGLFSDSTPAERKCSLRKLHVVKGLIAPKTHRAGVSVVSQDLPSKTEFIISVAMTSDQERAYKAYVDSLLTKLTDDKPTRAPTLMNWLHALSLLLNHPSIFIKKFQERKLNGSPGKLNHGEKGRKTGEAEDEDVKVDDKTDLFVAMQKAVDALRESPNVFRPDDPTLSNKSNLIRHVLLEAVKAGEKTLIFSKSIPTLDYYQDLVVSMKFGFKRLDGSTNIWQGKTRQENVKEFNSSDKFQVYLISTRAGGLGLNIQGATRVIVNDFDFNPTWEQQAIGRAYRIGQKNHVFVYRFLTGGTFEQLVHNTAVFKTQLFTSVVDLTNVKPQAVNQAKDYLTIPKAIEQQDLAGARGRDPLVLDAILDRVDCIRAIALTETLFQADKEELNEEEIKMANQEMEYKAQMMKARRGRW